jgi:hypothetical protein
MKPEHLLPLALLPGVAHAGGGGGAIIGVIIFLPVIIWAFIKIWTFWFRLIFGGSEERSTLQATWPYPEPAVLRTDAGPEMKICRYCAEQIQSKAVKCKHCGSDLNDQVGQAI